MSKFELQDRVLINNYPEKRRGTIVKYIEENNLYLVDIDSKLCGNSMYNINLFKEDELEKLNIMDEYVDNKLKDLSIFEEHDDYLTEMATIIFTNKYNIAFNNETDRAGIAYFKVYDSGKISTAKRVARLHFKDSGMEYHKHDRLKKEIWKLTLNEAKEIIEILKMPHKEHDSLSNWVILCYRWNSDNGLIPYNATLKEYLNGKFDHQKFLDERFEKMFIPSDTPIPDPWIYNNLKK